MEYLLQGRSAWGCFAMGFTVLPACVTQLFSLRWHRSDGSLRTVHWLLHFLLLGFLHRYLIFMFLHNLLSQIISEFCKLIYINIILFTDKSAILSIYIFVFRYLTLLYTAMHSLRNKSNFSKDKSWVYRQESDICMLHLFESFMGAAPQLILQLYIIAILHHAPFWTSKYYLLFFDAFKYYFILYFMYLYNVTYPQ